MILRYSSIKASQMDEADEPGVVYTALFSVIRQSKVRQFDWVRHVNTT